MLEERACLLSHNPRLVSHQDLSAGVPFVPLPADVPAHVNSRNAIPQRNE